MMKYKVRSSKQFKKDLKLIIRRKYKIELMDKIISLLAAGIPLPERNRDHDLSGNWIGYRECHITPDWLLIYKKENDILLLTLSRTGTHSDFNF